MDKFIGDNVMAVFGAPVAHEDDPARAVRAALGMQAAMAELREELGARFGMEPELRVGVNTGEVLAGRIGGAYTVVGDAVNVAARLQAAAPVGGVLVGERTRRLSAGEIAYRAIEPLALKGKAEPVPAWEAVELAADAARGAQRLSATPLIGREEELARLEAALERVVREGGAPPADGDRAGRGRQVAAAAGVRARGSTGASRRRCSCTAAASRSGRVASTGR